MKSRQKRQRRRQTRKVVHLNKMSSAPTLLNIEPPSRIFIKAIDEQHYMWEHGHRCVAYICNRTHILASSFGPHAAAALMMAACTLKDEVAEESMFLLDDELEAEAVADEPKVELVETKNEAGAFVGNNRQNPLHYVCPDCLSGLNEKCVSLRYRDGARELKTLHASRRRLASEAKD